MKHLISRRNFLKAAGVTTAAAAMAVGAPAASACWTGEKSEITILYTNDVHTYIDKQAPELTYAAIAALKQSYQNAGKKVLLVDAGDHVQGTAYGSMDQGASIIELMNAAGYDAATPGNHEFDYGMDQFNALVKQAGATYLSCNFTKLNADGSKASVFAPFAIETYKDADVAADDADGVLKVAYVGISTPETLTKSSPANFQDAAGNYIYGFCQDETGEALYAAVQSAVDEARAQGADYVVAVGHLGIEGTTSRWTSEAVIKHTAGIDALIDGHSHEAYDKTVGSEVAACAHPSLPATLPTTTCSPFSLTATSYA